MRKTLFILIINLMTNLGFSQETTEIDAKTNETKTYDAKLVGCWKGSETGHQKKELTKYWISCRFENGTSTLLFISIDKNGKVTQHTENIKWWVENGKYYELHNYKGLLDIYDYEIIPDGVKFKSNMSMGKKDTTYTFIDYKIE